MNEELEVQIRKALESSWSDKTSFCYSPEFPASYGQCAQTAIVVREKFGGEILKTRGWEENGKHFYNRINGRRYDFTSDQFNNPIHSVKIEYQDLLSSPEEAATEAKPIQIDQLREAFEQAMSMVFIKNHCN